MSLTGSCCKLFYVPQGTVLCCALTAVTCLHKTLSSFSKVAITDLTDLFMHLQPLYSDMLLPLWIHIFWFFHHCGKNRLCIKYVCLVILPLLLPYKLVLCNWTSFECICLFLVSFYTGRPSIAAVRLRLKKKKNQRKQMGFHGCFCRLT